MDPNIAAKNINIEDFNAILARYPEITEKLKPGREDLDQYRYVEAPARFSRTAKCKSIGLEDLQRLMEWKIRHGIYRPMLPGLIKKNTNEEVQTVTTEGFALHAKNPNDPAKALKKLAELKGVGPATASLILACHDPENVVFFSDEVFVWLVIEDHSPAKKHKLRYDMKEYQSLYEKSRELMSKLKVSPIDIEKVAYVIIKDPQLAIVKQPSESTQQQLGTTEDDKTKEAISQSPDRLDEPTNKRKRVAGSHTTPAKTRSGRQVKAVPTLSDDAKISPPPRKRASRSKKPKLEGVEKETES